MSSTHNGVEDLRAPSDPPDPVAELRRAAARLEALHQLDQAILAAESPTAIAEAVVQRIRQLLPSCSRASVTLFDLPQQTATILAVAVDGVSAAHSGTWPLADFPLGEEFYQGEIQTLPNLGVYADRSPLVRLLQAEGHRAAMYVPLRLGTEVIGSLSVASRTPAAFTAADHEVAREVAAPLAVAIQHARMRARIEEQAVRAERKAAELAALNQLGAVISRSLQTETVLDAAVEHVVATLRPDAVVVSLRHGDQFVVQARHDTRSAFPRPDAAVARFGECLCGLAASERQPIYSLQMHNDPRCTRPECKRAGLRSFAAIPLVGATSVIGVLGVASVAERDFRRHRDFLETCGQQIAVALQNALLHQDLQRTADELAVRAADLARTEESLRLDESRLNSLLHLAEKVEQLSEGEIVQVALEEAVRLTRSQIGYMHFVHEDQENLELHTWSPATLEKCTALHSTHYPLSEAGVWADCVRTGQPVVHNDYPSLVQKRGLPPGHSPLTRHVSVPALADGKVRTVLGVGNKTEPYDAADVRQLQLLADGVWKLIHRGRIAATLRASQQRLQHVISNHPVVVFGLDRHGRFTISEGRGLEQLGLLPGEAVGRSVFDLYADYPRVLQEVRQALTGAVTHAEVPVGERIYDVHYTPLRSASQEPDGIIGVATDITEQRRAKDALRERSRLAAFTAAISQALIQSGNLQEVLQACAAAVVRHLDAALARIWTLHPAESVLELQASAGLYTHCDGAHGRIPVGQFKVGSIAAERRPHLTNSVRGDPRVHDQAWAQREGLEAFAGYPLLVEERLVGVLGMFAREPLTDVTLQALASVASTIAMGIDRKRAEQALRASEAQFRRLAERSFDMIVTTTADGVIQYASPSAQRIFGHSPAVMIGRHFRDFVAPAELPRVLELFSRALRGDEVGVVQYEAVRADGRRLIVETNALPVRETSQEVTVHGVIRDITERIEADEQRRRMETELAHVARLSVMGELVAGIGHELNQPLYAILNFSKACRNLLSGSVPLDADSLREWTEEIARAADRAGAIVARLRDFTRRTELTMAQVALNTIVEESIQLLAFEARRRGVQVICELLGPSPLVTVDRIQVQQVLINLLNNAFEALANSTVPARQVWVHVGTADDSVTVCVADNGPGLPDADRVRIFEPFVTTKPEGLGMGLAISRTIVEAHGGRLWAEPSTAGGAAFHFTLPRRSPTTV